MKTPGVKSRITERLRNRYVTGGFLLLYRSGTRSVNMITTYLRLRFKCFAAPKRWRILPRNLDGCAGYSLVYPQHSTVYSITNGYRFTLEVDTDMLSTIERVRLL